MSAGRWGRVPRGEDHPPGGGGAPPPEPGRPAPPGCELNQEKRTWTFKPQKEREQDCKVLLSTVGVPARWGSPRGGARRGAPRRHRGALLCPRVTRRPARCLPAQICLGEKANEEMNLVEILPRANQEDKRTKPVTIAALQASALPTVSLSPRA